MTIAVIIACRDRFVVISDTLTRNDDSKFFSINTKKSFISEKHKVGLCIAGEAVLKPPSVTSNSQILHVEYVLNEYFDYLNSLDTFSVENMQTLLRTFFTDKYPQYWDWFDNNVSYFYGGPINIGGNITIAIYQHHVTEDSNNNPIVLNNRYFWSDSDSTTPCFFANTNAVQKYIDWTLGLQGTPKGMTAKKFLSEQTERQHFLTFTLPHACLGLNEITPHLIGQHLHCQELTLQDNSIRHKVIFYKKSQSATGITCRELLPQNSPDFLVYRSFKESNLAFYNKQLCKYSTTSGKQLPWPSQQANWLKASNPSAQVGANFTSGTIPKP